jgi:hypothetical protein
MRPQAKLSRAVAQETADSGPADPQSAGSLLAAAEPPKICIFSYEHEHDRIYTENLVEYLSSRGVLWRSFTLREDGYRPELDLCLEDRPTAVLGFLYLLDHCGVKSGGFLAAAEQQGLVALQWIVDHPSRRWHEFYHSTASNCRFLLNSEQEREYFETYCLPGAMTATMGGIGPNPRSRIGRLTRTGFLQRSITCMIPLSLHRIRSIEQNDAALAALEPRLAAAVRQAIASAQSDLLGSLHSHLAAALAASGQGVARQTFHTLCQIVEQAVQTFRRLKIFAAASKYPVLIQSDDSAVRFLQGSAASLVTNVSMQLTLARMPLCRAILSASPMNDMIHDRTMNALNAGCVAIAEDNLASKGLLQHKINALLFRYNDDSLDECLDIACKQPERAYEIAQAGMQLRDDPRIRFGQFHNVIDLARLPMKSTQLA